METDISMDIWMFRPVLSTITYQTLHILFWSEYTTLCIIIEFFKAYVTFL